MSFTPFILVLEDDNRMRNTLVRHAKEKFPDYDYLDFENPIDALPYLEEPLEYCAMLIFDNMLPGMHGLDFYAEFRKRSNSPALYITGGFYKKDDPARFMPDPLFIAIEKPFYLEEFIEAISILLKRSGKL